MQNWIRNTTVAVVGCAVLAGCSDDDDAQAPPTAQASVLSSRGETVSGGDALVRVQAPAGVDASALTVTLNGQNVTSSFRSDGSGGLIGLVTGLRTGANSLRTSGGGASDTETTLTNFPITGPIFSGPHEQPFICETTNFQLPDGTTLGAALDANCSVNTRVHYVYRTTATTGAQFRSLNNPQQLPSDLASTTTNDGRTVPYIVRVETGTINRGIYQISMLHDPSREATPSFTSAPAGWNKRLVYTFGGGCTGGWYRQGNSTGGVLDDNILKQGYAMASSSLNVFGNNCQDLTAAETMAMVKERFIEAYGMPRYTIGWGCSGGSYQQHQIADNYPGLLDGILPGCSFPEVAFATVYSITDARLLVNYFDNIAPGSFSQEQQRQVSGFLNYATMRTGTVNDGALRISPTRFCPAVLPQSQRYDPVTNRTGARCDVYDHTVNVFGRDPATGFARRPIDNVGVQYGLGALNAGAITVDQFLNLNERIGGYDVDANFQAPRTVGDPIAMRAAYQTGRLTNAGGGLKEIPIIDYRAYADDQTIGDIHLRYHSFSMRERLKKANGHADNQIMLVEDFRYGYYSSASPLLLDALRQMDQWIANIQADTSGDAKAVKVVRNKPASLQEGCLTRTTNPTKIVEKQDPTQGQCAQLYPAPGAPHQIAGAPLAADVIKCQLKPISDSDYQVVFTTAQRARLATVFPGGVCDWSKPGVEQQGLRGTWLSF